MLGKVGDVGEVGTKGCGKVTNSFSLKIPMQEGSYFLLVSAYKIPGRNPDCSLANHCVKGFGEIRWSETHHKLSTGARMPGYCNWQRLHKDQKEWRIFFIHHPLTHLTNIYGAYPKFNPWGKEPKNWQLRRLTVSLPFCSLQFSRKDRHQTNESGDISKCHCDECFKRDWED